MNSVNVIKRKVAEALRLLRNGEYFLFVSRLCANCLPSSNALFNKSYLMELRVQCPSAAITPRDYEYVVRQASPIDLTGIMECSKDDSSMASPELFQKFFRSKHVCYLIEGDEKVLGYSWVFFEYYCITYDGYKKSKINVHLWSHSVFIGNVFINPAYRRRGLYSRMLNAIVSKLHASRRISKVLMDVKASNSVALAAQKKCRFQITCMLYYLAIQPLTFFVAVPSIGRFRIYPGYIAKAIEYERLCGQVPAPGPSS